MFYWLTILNNNCATFATEVLSQDKKVKEQSPLFKISIPTHLIKQYTKKFSRVTYKNKNGNYKLFRIV